MSIADTIRDKLSVLGPESIELFDESGKHVGHQGAMGGGGHYQLIIVATAFIDQPLQPGQQVRAAMHLDQNRFGTEPVQKCARVALGKCLFIRVIQGHTGLVGKQGLCQGCFPGLTRTGHGDHRESLGQSLCGGGGFAGNHFLQIRSSTFDL
jgi:BolA protein